VKELVENSIDAEATSIRIELEKGGRSLLRVVDDGIGMGRADAVLALRRHATSKIRTDEDLFSIRTLGFRGEALPSIAEISRFELITGRRGEEVGTRLLVDGGKARVVEDAPNPGGTDIQVRRLFFNTPVRLKFLKTPRTEMTHVTQVVTRLAMAHPHIAFQLRSDGRTLLDAPRAEDLAGRLTTLLGRSVTAAMHSFESSSADIRTEGMISDPTLHRSTNAGVHLFVNGRSVRDRTLVAAILASFRPHLPRGRYPIVVLFVDVPPDRVDVNVHPAKTEVRFRDSRRLYRFLATRLSDRLAEITRGGNRPPSVESIVGGPEPIAVQATMALGEPVRPTFWGSRKALLMDRALPGVTPLRVRQTTRPSSPVPQPPRSPHGPEPAVRPIGLPRPRVDGTDHPRFSDLTVLAQYGGTYLICEEGTHLVVIDQGAARERILFEALSRRLPETSFAQRLLVPELLELDREAVDILVAFEPMLSALGVEVSSFGDGTVSVHALPAGVDPRRSHPILTELSKALRGRVHGRAGEQLRTVLASVLARHCVVGAAARLFPEEISELFAQLDRIDFARDWSEGRAIVVRFSRREVEGWFGRGSRSGG
jgi:DNA mismatch repair protein MutL